MNFLRTLFWVMLAVSLVILASRNWANVTLNLWGGLQADVKLPILLLVAFLVGFVPPYLILRGRVWSLKRRLLIAERPAPQPQPQPIADASEDL